jgi:hypothetical protein
MIIVYCILTVYRMIVECYIIMVYFMIHLHIT